MIENLHLPNTMYSSLLNCALLLLRMKGNDWRMPLSFSPTYVGTRTWNDRWGCKRHKSPFLSFYLCYIKNQMFGSPSEMWTVSLESYFWVKKRKRKVGSWWAYCKVPLLHFNDGVCQHSHIKPSNMQMAHEWCCLSYDLVVIVWWVCGCSQWVSASTFRNFNRVHVWL